MQKFCMSTNILITVSGLINFDPKNSTQSYLPLNSLLYRYPQQINETEILQLNLVAWKNGCKIFRHLHCKVDRLGTIHFLWGSGAGGIWGGPCKKIWLQRGGQPEKYGVKGGGVTKKISFKFSSDSICNNANISGRRPTIAILRFWKFKFSWGRMPQSPLLYYTPNGNSTPPTVSLQNTARGMSTLFWPLLVWF